MLVVKKFGGSSVADRERIMNVASDFSELTTPILNVRSASARRNSAFLKRPGR